MEFDERWSARSEDILEGCVFFVGEGFLIPQYVYEEGGGGSGSESMCRWLWKKWHAGFSHRQVTAPRIGICSTWCVAWAVARLINN